MPIPSIGQLAITGEWRDLWLYRGHLLLWRRDNSLLLIKQEEILKRISADYDSAIGAVYEYILFRNDWKNSDAFRTLLAVPGVLDALSHRILVTAGEVRVDPQNIKAIEVPSEAAPGILLDSCLYANVVYSATTDGLFENYLHIDEPRETPLHQASAHRTSSVSARFSALNASSGDEGLWFKPIIDERGNWVIGGQGMKKIADLSLGNSHASRHLLNYTDSDFPQFLRAQARKEKTSESAQFEEWRVTGYGQPTDLRGIASRAFVEGARVELHDLVGSPSTYSLSDFEVLGNNDYRLLVRRDGIVKVLNLSAYDGTDLAAKPRKDFNVSFLDEQADILDTYPFGQGFLIESFDTVQWLTDQGSQPFFPGAVARLRTFTSSRRHKDVAAAVTASTAYLIGFLPATAHSRSPNF